MMIFLFKLLKSNDRLDNFLYPIKSEEVLKILHQVKEIMLPITLTHIKKYRNISKECRNFEYYKEKYLKKLDPQFYSLLQNQE